jgi:N utilization substance protein A
MPTSEPAPGDPADAVRALLAREVPEIANGVVEIRAVGRLPGVLTKVMVESRDPLIDPIGACVGEQHERVKRVVERLGGERIHILLWKPSIEESVRMALAPVNVVRVLVDRETRQAVAVVRPQDVAQAVGINGANREAASLLLGFEIEIIAGTA